MKTRKHLLKSAMLFALIGTSLTAAAAVQPGSETSVTNNSNQLIFVAVSCSPAMTNTANFPISPADTLKNVNVLRCDPLKNKFYYLKATIEKKDAKGKVRAYCENLKNGIMKVHYTGPKKSIVLQKDGRCTVN